MVLAIDASRCRSGGSINHLIGILKYCNPVEFGIFEIHIWSYSKLLLQLPDRNWLVKHNTKFLDKSIPFQIYWQYFLLKNEIAKFKCNFLFTADASTFCNFKNQVVLSQDLLSYEPGVINKYRFGFSKLRLYLIRLIQNKAFRAAKGVIFLTNYTSKLIQASCGDLKNTIVIPHGFNPLFGSISKKLDWDKKISCIYISNAEIYKHQWVVVDAIDKLRKKKYDIKLNLVGGGNGLAQKKLECQIKRSDPLNLFVHQYEFLSHNEIIDLLQLSDLFIFASSCETFGITLLEGMATGIPIACSNRSSLPEVLRDGGAYFDPEDSSSIACAIEKLITQKDYAEALSINARALSSEYSWERCSLETFSFIRDCYLSSIKNEF